MRVEFDTEVDGQQFNLTIQGRSATMTIAKGTTKQVTRLVLSTADQEKLSTLCRSVSEGEEFANADPASFYGDVTLSMRGARPCDRTFLKGQSIPKPMAELMYFFEGLLERAHQELGLD